MKVGIAAFDLESPVLHLQRVIETGSSYQNTLTALEFFQPSDILVSTNADRQEGVRVVAKYPTLSGSKTVRPKSCCSIQYLMRLTRARRLSLNEDCSMTQRFWNLSIIELWSGKIYSLPAGCRARPTTRVQGPRNDPLRRISEAILCKPVFVCVLMTCCSD